MNQVTIYSEMDSDIQSMLYEREDFKKTMLIYMATWVALHSISVDYYNASKAIGVKVRNYIQTNLFEQDAFEEASRLAEEIMVSMNTEQSAIDESNAILEKMRLGI